MFECLILCSEGLHKNLATLNPLLPHFLDTYKKPALKIHYFINRVAE